MDGMGGLGRLGKWVGCGRRIASHTGFFFVFYVRLLVDVCVVITYVSISIIHLC